MKTAILSLCSLVALTTSVFAYGFEHFITRDGDRLMDGKEEFRFVSFNIPNLHYVEDDMEFERVMPFRMPDDFEINDALETIRQMGGRVARTYTLAVFKAGEPANTPKYVVGPGKFNEEAFQALDRVLAAANRCGIRLIIPFVNNFQWWGGAAEYAAFRGKKRDEFWNDPELIADFKKTVHFVLTRVNTITSVPYREDKAILAWETGNETMCPHSWTHEIAAYIHSLDANHLVMDGYNTTVLRDETIADGAIDVVQTHHYEKDPREMLSHIEASARKAAGKKPYMLGEFGFIGTEGVRMILDAVLRERLSGALIWSLRYHHRNGGFFWHSEPSGGDFFKAYHWPGFSSGEIYDEKNLMGLMRAKAFAIQGQPVPELEIPNPPVLLPIEDVGAIRWQGSAGASGYDVERAESGQGPWKRMAQNASDAEFQYRPLFNDDSAEIGKEYYYRVRAVNSSGTSQPSHVAGPVLVKHRSFIDEFENDSKILIRSNKLYLARNEARKYKEDIHRLNGDRNEWLIYRVEGPMKACKLYSFFADAASDLTFAISADGKEFKKIATQKTDFSAGEGEYGYLRPILYTLDSFPENAQFLKIEFAGPGSLSRIEIQYGQ
ncbi:MAG: hypothetical protein AB1656_04855 [Candidatus Omnitrophota bacterium]